MQEKNQEIKEVIWIDKNVFNEENQGYKQIMENLYGLKVRVFNDSKSGIEAIKETETYSPIFILTSGSIYPEFYRFFKNAVTYIKNLPVQIIFTSNTDSFLAEHENDEIGRQIGGFYNLGGVTDIFSQVESFIQKTNEKLRNYKVNCLYTYNRSQDFSGLQTFTYLYERKTLYLPTFFGKILIDDKLDENETSTFIHFMLNNFGNENICKLFKGMILFNDIPEPILSKFFARAYTLESPFYGIMNQNLMKRNYKYYSTYIKFLYKGILNDSYPPKTDCNLYRGTKLEGFEIKYLKDLNKMKKMGKEIPIIYCTSFLSFSTSYTVAKNLEDRREISPKEKDEKIKVDEISTEDESPHKKAQPNKKDNQKPNKLIANKIKVKPVFKIKKQNLKFVEPKKDIKVIQKHQPLIKGFQQAKKGNKSIPKFKPLAKATQQTKKVDKSKSKKKDNHYIKTIEQNKNKNVITNEDSQPKSNTVRLILNPLKEEDKDKIMLTNGFLNQISYFHDEDEVLFFPFSGFELVDVYEEDSTTFIVLDYSSRFTRKVENCIFSDTLI